MLAETLSTRAAPLVEAPANDVQWLIDNAEAYREFADAIARAQESICISQLAFDADCLVYALDGQGIRLLDALVDASARGVTVRIVLNESFLLDTATALRKALRRAGATDIEVRGVSCFPRLLHAKMLIVDEREAFVIGSPFVNGYWDDNDHRPDDARRPARELGGRPLHDVSFRVAGPACDAMLAFFEELWSDVAVQGERRGRALDSVVTNGVSIRTTLPRNASALRPDGEREILGAMLDGISRAREFIYLEHQYLCSRRVVAALARALALHPSLEIVALLNQNADVTAYRVWQRDRLAMHGLLDHPRVGLFALWSRAPADDGRVALNQVFVHSKILVVDDAWATAGSANVDGVSLHSYGADFKSRLGERIFRHTRNIDLNVVLDAAIDPALVEPIVSLREALWAEHLPADNQPAASGLARWRAVAQVNQEQLSSGAREELHAGTFILPFCTSAYPVEQLAELGVRENDVDLRFNPGWLEVHCSPNWIRNMFA